jgi:hypothetical protein
MFQLKECLLELLSMPYSTPSIYLTIVSPSMRVLCVLFPCKLLLFLIKYEHCR